MIFSIWLQEEGLGVLWKIIFHRQLPTLQKDFLNGACKDASDSTQGVSLMEISNLLQETKPP